MENTTDRKQKAPVAAILLWLMAACQIIAYVLSLVHLIDYPLSVYSIIAVVLYIVIGLFSLLKKNYPLFFCVAAYAVVSVLTTHFSFEGDILFGVIIPVVSLLTVLLVLFILGTQVFPFLSSLKRVGKVMTVIPTVLQLFVTIAKLIDALFSLATEDYFSPYYTVGYSILHFVLPNILPDLIIGVIFAIVYYSLLERAIDPYANKQTPSETAANAQPMYGVPAAGTVDDLYTEMLDPSEPAANAQPMYGVPAAGTADDLYTEILDPSEPVANAQPAYGVPAAGPAVDPYGGIQDLPKTAAYAQPAYGAPTAGPAVDPYAGIQDLPKTAAYAQPAYGVSAAGPAVDPYAEMPEPSGTAAPQPAYSAPDEKTAAFPEEHDEIYCSLVKHMLLLVFTCGIWYLIWIYRSTKYLNRAPEGERYAPAKKMLLVLFVPFYQIFWFYRHGQKLERFLTARNHAGSGTAALCLIFGIFMPFVSCFLMQDKFNLLCTAAGGRKNGVAVGTTAAAEESPEIYCPLVRHILLSVFTCGIWYLIWIRRSTKYLNRAPEGERCDPTKKTLLVLFVPFYQMFWYYRHGQKLESFLKARGYAADNMAALCLFLGVFMPFAACFMMQDKYNLLCTAAGNREPAPVPAPDLVGVRDGSPAAPSPDYFGVYDTSPDASSAVSVGVYDASPAVPSPENVSADETMTAAPSAAPVCEQYASPAVSSPENISAGETVPAVPSDAPVDVWDTFSSEPSPENKSADETVPATPSADSVASYPAASAAPTADADEDSSDDGSAIVALFIQYKQQLDAGIMTPEEFAEKKKRLLGI